MRDPDTQPDLQFELTDDDRRHLRQMMSSPGYETLQKIQRSYIDTVRQSAIDLSSTDPIGNQADVLKQWSYVAVAEEYIRQVDRGVKFELDILRQNSEPPKDPAAEKVRRRTHRLSGSLQPLR